MFSLTKKITVTHKGNILLRWGDWKGEIALMASLSIYNRKVNVLLRDVTLEPLCGWRSNLDRWCLATKANFRKRQKVVMSFDGITKVFFFQ